MSRQYYRRLPTHFHRDFCN